MREDLVDIYEAGSVVEAATVASRLREAGIDVFVDNDDSPLAGLTAGEQTLAVRVLPRDAERARAILAEPAGDADAAP